MATQGGITVRIEGLDDLRRKLNGARADAPVKRFLDRGATLIQGLARRKVKVDTGRTRNSIGVEAPSMRERRIGPNVAWGEALEVGSRPHWPPVSALEGWARRHGVSAFAVARAISVRGTKAQPFMQPAADEAEGQMPPLVSLLAAELESAYQ